MATWYSDHYTTTGEDQSSLPTLRSDAIPDTNRKHGRVRISRAYALVTNGAASDVVRMLTLRSDARLHWLCVFTDGGFDQSSSADVGVYLSGDDHNGAVEDADLFEDGLDVTSNIDTWDAAEIFSARSSILATGILRGAPLWEILAAGSGTDTEDPKVLYDLGIFLNGNDTTAGKLVMAACYTAGD